MEKDTIAFIEDKLKMTKNTIVLILGYFAGIFGIIMGIIDLRK